MRKVIAIVIIIVLAGSLYFYFSSTTKKQEAASKEAKFQFSESSLITELKEQYDKTLANLRDIQKNPDQIAELNCVVTKLLYSGTLTEEEVKLLLKFQREYYTKETLENNPEEANYDRLQAEVNEYKNAQVNIIGYKIVGPQYVDVAQDEKKMIIFNAIYYLNLTSDQGDVFKGYVFEQNEEKLWELKGFGSIEDFGTVH